MPKAKAISIWLPGFVSCVVVYLTNGHSNIIYIYIYIGNISLYIYFMRSFQQYFYEILVLFFNCSSLFRGCNVYSGEVINSHILENHPKLMQTLGQCLNSSLNGRIGPHDRRCASLTRGTFLFWTCVCFVVHRNFFELLKKEVVMMILSDLDPPMKLLSLLIKEVGSTVSHK